MAWPAETISTDTMQSPPGAVPEGLKIASFAGPNSFDSAATPVIRVGSFTLWPMSYYDNRVSLGMVVYDPCGCPVRVVEKPGARYVYKITNENGSVTVWGQADQRVTLSPDDIGGILVPES
jgi:hypothetical protein